MSNFKVFHSAQPLHHSNFPPTATTTMSQNKERLLKQLSKCKAEKKTLLTKWTLTSNALNLDAFKQLESLDDPLQIDRTDLETLSDMKAKIEEAHKNVANLLDSFVGFLDEYTEEISEEEAEGLQYNRGEIVQKREEVESRYETDVRRIRKTAARLNELKFPAETYGLEDPNGRQTTGAAVFSEKKNFWDINKDFKPEVLRHDAPAKTLEDFILNLKLYLPKANVEATNALVASIQGLVSGLMTESLKVAINFNRSEELLLYTPNENGDYLVGRLENYWDSQFPINIRRNAIFGVVQKPGETFLELKARVIDLFSRADVMKMSEVEMIGFFCMKALIGEEGKKIRDLALDNLKGAKAGVEIVHLESAYNTIVSKSKHDELDNRNLEQARRVDHQRGNTGRDQRTKSGGPLHPKLAELRKEGKCFFCARQNCQRKDACIAKGKTCDHCKLQNHLIAACKKKYDEDKAKSSSGGSSGAGPRSA